MYNLESYQPLREEEMTSTIENIIEEIRNESPQAEQIDPSRMPHVVISLLLEERASELWGDKEE